MSFATRRSLLPATISILVLLPFALTAAEIVFCHETCVCLYWQTGGTGYSEVRCPTGLPSGWTIGGSTPTGTGSWAGSGTSKPPPAPLPGNVMNPETYSQVQSAKTAAVAKLRGEKVSDLKGVWLPTTCTDLFLNSPLGKPGAYLLGNYVVLRDGTSVKDSQGADQCALGTVAAWTSCCLHDPVVFICPKKFKESTTSDRIKYLIHETMHVGGQQEDKDGTVGPVTRQAPTKSMLS
jgi:hypothetical protein